MARHDDWSRWVDRRKAVEVPDGFQGRVLEALADHRDVADLGTNRPTSRWRAVATVSWQVAACAAALSAGMVPFGYLLYVASGV